VAYDFTSGSLTADPDLLLGQPDPLATLGLYETIAHASVERNPQTYVNFINQGYVLVDVSPCATTIEFKTVDTYDANAQPEVIARFRVHTEATTMESEFFPAPAYSAGPGAFQEPPPGATGHPAAAPDCGYAPPPQPTDPDPSDPGSTSAPPAGTAPASARPASNAVARPSAPDFTG
jgi:hypothetical protein